MAANYVLLEKITVGAAGASSVTFTSIPQTGYTDLVVKVSPRNTGSGAGDSSFLVEFNGSSTTYTGKTLYSNGSTPSSFNETTPSLYGNVVSSWTANTFGNNEIYIPNYTSANYKSFSADGVGENNATRADASLGALLWSNTAAITSITVKSYASFTFAQYTTFYLYGVAKLGTTPAIVPYATGGDTIMTDGTYWYHTFISSGTFTPAKALSCDYLVVAGGGGGGKHQGGGGGAGGLRSTVTATGGGGTLETALSLTAQGYTVTVGAGGAGTSTGNTAGLQGSNSVFSTITSIGGGGGGYYNTNTATNGGAGGGAPGGATAKTVGTGTANQGFNGGNGSTDSGGNGGGGGGAGAVGGNAVNGVSAGNGGIGVATSISGSSTYYAGGGGGGRQANGSTGGTGGTGGGGTGAQGDSQTAGSGTSNTGGGGGGETQNNGTSGNGGSGLVIVRYAV